MREIGVVIIARTASVIGLIAICGCGGITDSPKVSLTGTTANVVVGKSIDLATYFENISDDLRKTLSFKIVPNLVNDPSDPTHAAKINISPTDSGQFDSLHPNIYIAPPFVHKGKNQEKIEATVPRSPPTKATFTIFIDEAIDAAPNVIAVPIGHKVVLTATITGDYPNDPDSGVLWQQPVAVNPVPKPDNGPPPNYGTVTQTGLTATYEAPPSI